MAGNNMHNLTTLVKRYLSHILHVVWHYRLMLSAYRLEAATSRLEDIASSTSDPNATTNGATSVGDGVSASSRLEKPPSSTPKPRQLPEPLPPSIEGFDALINSEVGTFVNMSEELGGLVAEQVCCVEPVLSARCSAHN